MITTIPIGKEVKDILFKIRDKIRVYTVTVSNILLVVLR